MADIEHFFLEFRLGIFLGNLSLNDAFEFKKFVLYLHEKDQFWFISTPDVPEISIYKNKGSSLYF